MPANLNALVKLFGYPQPPSHITQEPFDYDPGHYIRLCKSPHKPDPIDLHSYADDLLYQDIQKDLFLYFLPVCLRAWQQDLMSSHKSDYAGFVEQFSAGLARHGGFCKILTSVQLDAVATFMKDVILDKIDQERSLSFSGMDASPYSWINAIGTFGTVFPKVSQLWQEWWSVCTAGRACGVLQYASVLMYADDKNPIFSPWTQDAGGGAPDLWETDGFIDEYSWLQQNIEFLRSILTPSYILEKITNAANVLNGEVESSVPEQMVSGWEDASVLVELRIEELMKYLSVPLGKVREWKNN